MENHVSTVKGTGLNVGITSFLTREHADEDVCGLIYETVLVGLSVRVCGYSPCLALSVLQSLWELSSPLHLLCCGV